MADSEKKARDLIAEAEKKKKPGFMGGLFSGGSSKNEEASELYVRAANMYKMAKNWNAAGDSFCKSAELQLTAGSKHEAASNYVDAATCFKKSNPGEAVSCLMKAVEIYIDMGRFTIAAKHHMTIAEIFETDNVDLQKAVDNYQLAADYYRGEESKSSANKCLLKVAQYAAQMETYEKAIEIYEQIGSEAIESPLLKYSAKEYFFKACVCHLCVDLLNAQQAVARYEESYPAFGDTREAKLVKKLIAALEEENADEFTDAVKEYDTISRLDQWYTQMLLRVKKGISGEGDLR